MTNLDPRRYVIIGVGGIGTHLSDILSQMLAYKSQGSTIVLVDGDSFEEKNLDRQSFEGMGPKALIKAIELEKKYPSINIVPVASWVVSSVPEPDEDGYVPTDVISVSDLLQPNDIVFAVVDNFACRKIIFDQASTIDNIDVFSGGNDDALDGSVTHYQRRNGADVTCHPGAIHHEFVTPTDRNPGEMSCQERAQIEGETQLLVTNATVAVLLASRVHEIIFNETTPEVSEIFFDLSRGLMTSYDRRGFGEDFVVETTKSVDAISV